MGSLDLLSDVLFLSLLLVEVDVIILSVPLSEWVGINNDNAVLHNSLGSNKLVVGGIVDDIKNSGLSGDAFRSPGEVSSVDLQGSVLVIASSGSDWSDSLGSKLGVGWLSSHFKLSLLLVNWHSSTSGPSLVS